MHLATRPSPTKVCPVVIRQRSEIEVLAFAHPLAGLQLVKGTIEPHESASAAALRELHEESGIYNATIVADLGHWVSGYQDQTWSFHLCATDVLPDTWTHRTQDDGCHDFAFFWHPLSQPPDEQWHAVFQGALKYIARQLPEHLQAQATGR